MDYTPEQLRTGVLKTCDEIVCEQYLGEMYLQRLLIFVISLVTKKVHSLLAWTECTKHKQNKQF